MRAPRTRPYSCVSELDDFRSTKVDAVAPPVRAKKKAPSRREQRQQRKVQLEPKPLAPPPMPLAPDPALVPPAQATLPAPVVFDLADAIPDVQLHVREDSLRRS